ncbi:MAG: glycosyltransferase family 1 protein [Chloroflexota bacterium]|nr:glycosyltransferase family 1 protein [Chloroflexota bacterium]MDQ5864726.1 glycosyltransferase family 1 protein [Chloroflexota bacterium]
MNIIVAGVMGRYPYGGVVWCSLMYLLGLMRLEHKVWYLEDMGECNFDPVENTLSKDPRYAVNFIRDCLQPYGLEDRWCYVDWRQRYHGHTREQWLDVCAGADLFINLSGGCAFWRDEYASIPHSAYIDTDPGFTQLDAARRPERLDFLSRYGSLFTFGRNIGTPASLVPALGLDWEHTWQPVLVDWWRPTNETPRDAFTTVMTWRIASFKEIGGNKDQELLRFLDLPRHVSTPLELAVNGPRSFLEAHGWVCRAAFEVSHNPSAYRDYIASSLGEFSVAKHTYVATNSGWFSDRTACYLASGRPAVVQDTGFSVYLPSGSGLVAFRTFQEAQDGLENVTAHYPHHANAARELAVAYFAPEVVLPPLLERATQNKRHARKVQAV